jgi:putative acetyltransferase
MLSVAQETPRQPEVEAMLAALDAYCAALYPAESNHLLGVDALLRPDVTFFVARGADRQVLGCGAAVDCGAYMEVKRMYVAPASRGLGAGQQLLRAIEVCALIRGRPALMLETGIHQPEAIGLYEKAGFARCAPFGAYGADPLSIFMEKRV